MRRQATPRAPLRHVRWRRCQPYARSNLSVSITNAHLPRNQQNANSSKAYWTCTGTWTQHAHQPVSDVTAPVLAARGEMGQRYFRCTCVYPADAERGRLTPGNASPFR
jgi:hypothetical protein